MLNLSFWRHVLINFKKENIPGVETFDQRLRKTMKEKGKRQADIVNNFDISRQAMSNYYSGRTLPDASKIVELATALDVSADYLLGLTDMMPSKDSSGDNAVLSKEAIKNLQYIDNLAKGKIIDPYFMSEIENTKKRMKRMEEKAVLQNRQFLVFQDATNPRDLEYRIKYLKMKSQEKGKLLCTLFNKIVGSKNFCKLMTFIANYFYFPIFDDGSDYKEKSQYSEKIEQTFDEMLPVDTFLEDFACVIQNAFLAEAKDTLVNIVSTSKESAEDKNEDAKNKILAYMRRTYITSEQRDIINRIYSHNSLK